MVIVLFTLYFSEIMNTNPGQGESAEWHVADLLGDPTLLRCSSTPQPAVPPRGPPRPNTVTATPGVPTVTNMQIPSLVEIPSTVPAYNIPRLSEADIQAIADAVKIGQGSQCSRSTRSGHSRSGLTRRTAGGNSKVGPSKVSQGRLPSRRMVSVVRLEEALNQYKSQILDSNDGTGEKDLQVDLCSLLGVATIGSQTQAGSSVSRQGSSPVVKPSPPPVPPAVQCTCQQKPVTDGVNSGNELETPSLREERVRQFNAESEHTRQDRLHDYVRDQSVRAQRLPNQGNPTVNVVDGVKASHPQLGIPQAGSTPFRPRLLQPTPTKYGFLQTPVAIKGREVRFPSITESGGAVPKGTDTKRKPIPKPVAPLRTYNGSTPWNEYQSYFERTAILNEWDEGVAVQYLHIQMEGKALKTLNRMSPEVANDYGEFCEAMAAQYDLPLDLYVIYRAELNARVRKKGERLPDLSEDIQRLVDLAYPNIPPEVRLSLSLEAFGNALETEAHRLLLSFCNVNSMKDAQAVAMKVDSYLAGEKVRGKDKKKGAIYTVGEILGADSTSLDPRFAKIAEIALTAGGAIAETPQGMLPSTSSMVTSATPEPVQDSSDNLDKLLTQVLQTSVRKEPQKGPNPRSGPTVWKPRCMGCGEFGHYLMACHHFKQALESGKVPEIRNPNPPAKQNNNPNKGGQRFPKKKGKTGETSSTQNKSTQSTSSQTVTSVVTTDGSVPKQENC